MSIISPLITWRWDCIDYKHKMLNF